jgi:H+-transporting ATPase
LGYDICAGHGHISGPGSNNIIIFIFSIGISILQLSQDVLQLMMYLKLSVAGHFLTFITRTKGHFWSYRPSNILRAAVLGTQIVATIIADYGLLIPP